MAKRIISAVILLPLAAGLVWYGVWSYKIESNDLQFIERHASTGLFPKAWLRQGDWAYDRDSDPADCAVYYAEAILRQPLLIDAWLGLVSTQLAQGLPDKAQQTMSAVAPHIAHVSTWKWRELVLASYLRDEDHFSTCFNFILSRLPHHAGEASRLAQDFWGSWSAVLPHTKEENHVVLLNELIKAKESRAALTLWKMMEESLSPADRDLRLRFCHFLLAQDQIGAAKEIWKSYSTGGIFGVHDGGFEQEPINAAFGWQVRTDVDVSIKRGLESYEGKYSLHLRFLGKENVNFHHISQVVPVEPGTDYRLRFASRCRNLTTDHGVFLSVSGYRCKGLSAQSRPIIGTNPWMEEEMRFSVPGACEAVSVRVCRKESLMFDNKISGDYWLDAVVLESERPGGKANDR